MSHGDSEEKTAFLSAEKWDTTLAAETQKVTVISRLLQRHITWAVLGCLVSSLFFAAVELYSNHWRHSGHEQRLLPSDGFWPDVPVHTSVFVDDHNWKDTGVIGDRLWEDLLPVGGGYVPVPYPRKYNLPDSAPFAGSTKEEAMVYSAAVVHQLHCLATLRETLKSYDAGEPPKFGGGHPYHCLNYLRLAVQCASDTAFENGHPSWNEAEKKMEYEFSGVGSVHQCRDWNTVKNFLESHRGNSQKDII